MQKKLDFQAEVQLFASHGELNLDEFVLPGAQAQLFGVLQADLPLGIRVGFFEIVSLVAAQS